MLSDAKLSLVTSFAECEELMRWLGQARPWLGVDTETSGLDWWRDTLRMVQVGDANHGWAIPFQDFGGLIKEILSKYDRRMVFHNVKFDLHFLEHNGIRVNRSLLHDTRAMAHILEPHLRSGLKAASVRHVDPLAAVGDKELKLAMMKGKWTWGTVPIDLPAYWVYSALDPVITARLAEALYPQISLTYSKLYDIEVGVAITLKDMEHRGMRINQEYTRQKSAALLQYEEAFRIWVNTNFGISNPNSDQEISRFFHNHGIMFTRKTTKGNTSMSAESLRLQAPNHPLTEPLISFRNANKTRSTYFDDFTQFSDSAGFIHTSINPLGARTGRMSSSRPNLQNVPANKLVRSAFVPQPGNKLILADFDQIELRLMAHYSNEPTMIKAVLDGEDLHSFVGRMVYGVPEITPEQRRVVKAANFAKIYGAGVAKFADTAGITLDEAAVFMKTYDARFSDIPRFMGVLTTKARTSSIITPYLGRKQVADKDSAYKIVNYYIQGTAADVLKRKVTELAMTDSSQFMALLIHDEIAFDVPEQYVDYVKEEVGSVMPEMDSFSLPLSVSIEVVDSWGQKYG